MKVGLIAMSGTRILDPESLKVATESIGVSTRLAVIGSLPSLALLTVAAVLGDQAEVEYLQCSDLNTWKALPGDFDLVAISSYSAFIHDAYELADRYKALGIPVVLGGTHVSVMPEETIARGHTAAIGEAEVVWPDIIRDAKAGCLKTSYGQLGEVCDLTKSPIPAFELLDPEEFKRIPIQTSRGCRHRCEFCAASVLTSPRYRQKSIEQVLLEIDRVLQLWKRPFIEFVDDNALVDRKYWKKLMQELGKRKIRWFAECDIAVGDDEELLELMRLSGCREVLIGLESPAQDDLKGVELNSDWKYKTHSQYRQTITKIHAHGVRVIGCFILGLDHQTPASADLIYDFVKETNLFEVQLTLQTAFPGTPLYHRLKQEGRLRYSADHRFCTLFDLNIVPSKMTEDELLDSYHNLIKKVHDNTESALRYKRFKDAIKERIRTGGNVESQLGIG